MIANLELSCTVKPEAQIWSDYIQTNIKEVRFIGKRIGKSYLLVSTKGIMIYHVSGIPFLSEPFKPEFPEEKPETYFEGIIEQLTNIIYAKKTT